MNSTTMLERIDALIDELLNQGGLPASSLASMLMAARDSVRDGYHVALARRVWDASNTLKDHYPSPLSESLTVAASGVEPIGL